MTLPAKESRLQRYECDSFKLWPWLSALTWIANTQKVTGSAGNWVGGALSMMQVTGSNPGPDETHRSSRSRSGVPPGVAVNVIADDSSSCWVAGICWNCEGDGGLAYTEFRATPPHGSPTAEGSVQGVLHSTSLALPKAPYCDPQKQWAPDCTA